MHLYRYFLKCSPPENDDFEYSLNDQYPLYGFTCDKKIAKRFEKERNMKKFIRRESNVTKEEYVEYANRNRLNELRLKTLQTSLKESENGQVKIVMSLSEYEACDLELVMVVPYEETFWTGEAHYPPYVYRKSIREALEFIDYVNIYDAYFSEEENSGYIDFRGIDLYNYFLELSGDTFL